MSKLKKFTKYITSIIVVLLCLLIPTGLFEKAGCNGMGERIITIIIVAFILFILALVLIFELHYRNTRGKSFNYFPFLTFGVCISLYFIISFFQSDRFRSEVVFYAKSSETELTLRQNETYEYNIREPEYGCTETGSYHISNDTIYLICEHSFSDKQPKNRRFLIEKKRELVIPVYGDSLDVGNYLEIERK